MYGGGQARPPPQETPGGAQASAGGAAQSAKQAHPLDIKPLVATNRFKQSTYEVFQPLPIKAYYVASSGGGKSSAAIAAINALFPLYDTFAIFASTIHVDPSFDTLRKRIKDKMKQRGRTRRTRRTASSSTPWRTCRACFTSSTN